MNKVKIIVGLFLIDLQGKIKIFPIRIQQLWLRMQMKIENL